MDIKSATIEHLEALVEKMEHESISYRSTAKQLKQRAEIKIREGNRIAKEAEEIKKVIELYKNQ